MVQGSAKNLLAGRYAGVVGFDSAAGDADAVIAGSVAVG
jgi:hypothetical protein